MQYVVAVLVGLVLAEVATLITSIYLHRVLSHKSIRLHPALTMFMRWGTWMLTSISPREWVAVHRKHHNFSDVEGDPHSPHIEGYWQIMLANVYYYRREANYDDTLEKYTADLPFDRLDKALFRRGTIGFGLTGLILVLLIGLGPGLVALFTLAVVYLLLNAAINGAGHTFGYKSFANDATNLRLLALITFGEGLHNNHHARPASPKLSAFCGEFDPAWPVIRLLVALRLAEVLSKVDEGWENHRRRIPRTVVSPVGTSTGKLAQPNARMQQLESASVQVQSFRRRTSAMVTLMDQGLHYEVNGTGAPVLLIHGTGSLRVWDPVVRRGSTTPAQKG